MKINNTHPDPFQQVIPDPFQQVLTPFSKLQKATGTDKALEITVRINAETQTSQMGIPEAQSGYRASTGAPNVQTITNDVNSNSGYSGLTHGSSMRVRNTVIVTW